MDKPDVTTPDPLPLEPAGEANTAVSSTPPTDDAVEPQQVEPVHAPVSAPEIPSETVVVDLEATSGQAPQPEALSETLLAVPETSTPQMGGNEALPPSAPVHTPEVVELDSGSAAGMTMPAPLTQQGSAQPEPTAESTRPSLVANSEGRSGDEGGNILKLIFKKGLLTIKLRKQKKLIKVMGLFATKKSITNDDVEKLLHVSDATATRYLSDLVKQGKIMQIGKTGTGVTYVKR